MQFAVKYLTLPNGAVRSKLLIALLLVLFLTFTLNFLEPFTIRNHAADLRFALLISGYGMISGIILFFNELWVCPFLVKYFKPHRYSFIIKQIGYLFTLALGVWGYSNVLYLLFPIYHFPAFSYFQALEKTLLLGIIPFSFYILHQNIQARYKPSVKEPFPSEVVHLQGLQAKDWLRIPLQQLLFIESADNYVTIYYLEGQKITRKLLRGSLKHIETQVTDLPLKRCHHSYIINILMISHFEGNLRGMKLHIFQYDYPIPVSRKYAAQVAKELEALPVKALAEA